VGSVTQNLSSFCGQWKVANSNMPTDKVKEIIMLPLIEIFVFLTKNMERF
jgi:hypothetical protein